MKLLVILFTSLLSLSSFADDIMSPQVVPVAYKNIYVPGGFDSNDSVQFAADGVFSSACYKIAPPSVAVDEAKKIITVQAQAYLYGGLCAMVLIPFQQVVQVGIVATPGHYNIVDDAGQVIGSIDIKPATTALEDDYLYAPVQKMSVSQVGGENKLTLKMEFTDNCMKIKEVKVLKEPNVFVIQPIVEMSTGAACAQGYFPWTEEVDLGPLQKKRYLIHVRTSGSQALNEILVN